MPGLGGNGPPQRIVWGEWVSRALSDIIENVRVVGDQVAFRCYNYRDDYTLICWGKYISPPLKKVLHVEDGEATIRFRGVTEKDMGLDEIEVEITQAMATGAGTT